MTKKEFKYAMQRGLGRCILELKSTDDIEKYRDLVLWGCCHGLAYDVQSEGSRSYYLYEMILQFPDVMPFLHVSAKKMDHCIRSTGWEFLQICQLLALFAGDGNEFAVHSLQQCYEKLLDILKRKRKRTRQGLLPERDNFEELCISIVTYSSELSFCMKKYLAVAADIGELLKANPLFDCWSFAWFQAACESSLGGQRVLSALKKQAKSSASVRTYIAAMEERETGWKGREKGNENAPAATEEVYANLSNGKQTGRDICSYALDIEQLISDTDHMAEVIAMLAVNYHKQDQETFVNLVKSIPISYDDGAWHGAFSSVRDMFEDQSIKNPPKELLLYMYEHTLCSFCRCEIVKEMGRRRMLTDGILQECLYDSNQEIREYARKKLESQRTALQKFLSRRDKTVDRVAALE